MERIFEGYSGQRAADIIWANDQELMATIQAVERSLGAIGGGILPTPPNGGTLPAPDNAGFIVILPEGTYNLTGGGTLTTPPLSFNVAYWDGATWSLSVSETITVDLTNYALKTELIALQNILNGVVVTDVTPVTSAYPAGTAGTIWTGDIGSPLSTANNASWTPSTPVYTQGSSTVKLHNYMATSSTQTLAIAVNSVGVIVAKLVSGAAFADGEFEMALPSNTAYVVFNILTAGVAAATIELNAPQIRKAALVDVYGALGAIADFYGATPKPYPAIASGIWTGDVGSTIATTSNSAWTRSAPIVAGAGETLTLIAHGSNADTNQLVYVMGADDTIIAKFVAGAGYQSHTFTYTLPAGASYVLLNFYSANAAYPVSGGIVVVGAAPQIRKAALVDVYAAINAETGNALNGMRYAALGDSITALSQGYTYASRIADWAEASQYTNYAIGGATWAYRAGTVPTDDPVSSDDTNVVPNQVRKLVKAFNDGIILAPDLITLSAGINDVARGLALGDIITEFDKPLNSVDMETLVGAIRWSVSTLMQTFPDVRILLLTPLLTSVNVRRYEVTLPYANMIKSTSARLAVPVIDCFGESLINEVNQSRYMQPDNLHPNGTGQQMQALYVYRQLRNRYYTL